MLSDADMYERMVRGWRAGKPETICGQGSTSAQTAHVREWLPQMVRRYRIGMLVDAGAGDQVWIERVQWAEVPPRYLAVDLIPRNSTVRQLDITREALPVCDAILCRMVLNHLDEPRITMALALFRKSARYLIATHFQGEDLPQRSPQFTRLDLRGAPYGLGEPLERVQDGVEPYCYLALWQL
jgi:hypothetical protein